MQRKQTPSELAIQAIVMAGSLGVLVLSLWYIINIL